MCCEKGQVNLHHGASPLRCGEFGCDDGRKRVVTADSNTHQDTPEDNETNDRDTGPTTNERLSKSCDDDENQLKTVHLLATNDISKGTKTNLTDDGTSGGGELDGGILGSEENALVVLLVNDTQHDGQKRDTKDIITVCEETSAGNENGADMVPAKGCFVDLSERKTATFVGLFAISECVMDPLRMNLRPQCERSH